MSAQQPKPCRQTSRRTVLKAAAATTLLSSLGRAADERRGTPNILILISDDQGRELGSYGRTAVQTPRLDRLAREGLVFENAYTPVAVCVPSRSVLYTGLYPTQNGATGFNVVNKELRTWGHALADAGYYTGSLGKLAVKPPKRFPFDFRESGEKQDQSDVAWYVQQFERFLAQRPGAKPFCMAVGFHDPHRPYPRDGGRTGWKGADEKPHDWRTIELPPSLIDRPEVRMDFAHFYDAIRRMDTTVGALLDVLSERELARDTLVLFTSDNGIAFPFGKTTLYEAGIHMPLIARWPGVVEPGRRSDDFVSFVDFLPTCLDLAGSAPRAELPGLSLAAVLRGEGKLARDAIFGSHTHHREEPSVPCRSVRVGNWKYIQNLRNEQRFGNKEMLNSICWRLMEEGAKTDPGLAERVRLLQFRPKHELYDLANDPYELRNLAGDPEHAEQRKALQARLKEFMRSIEDPFLAEYV